MVLLGRSVSSGQRPGNNNAKLVGGGGRGSESRKQKTKALGHLHAVVLYVLFDNSIVKVIRIFPYSCS